MDPSIYKYIHYVGIFMILTGLGGLIFAETKAIKLAGMSHGIGLFLTLLGGMGMQKHEAIGFSSWFIIKLVIWLLLGALIVVAKRKLLPPVATWLTAIILVSVAAWLGFANSVILRGPAPPPKAGVEQAP
ncbi:MAG: hypothetical protein HKO57_09325 [Akkermansiaceae bacterium]|nr:hypothetical protein [Akkermansiaceae bacterium]